ncbi:MAG: DUF3656 domain-containing protein, partial [Bacillota bacterium]
IKAILRAHKPELLAPAGSWESLVAAVQNGADAVYLGGKSFNARQSAENFAADDLVRVVDYAHVRGVKVYVTVNVLIDDNELEKAAALLYAISGAGADGVIVQDLGLARLARRLLPDLELHASTQMTVHNPASAVCLKEIGFSRIVLARELSLPEVAHLKQQAGIEVEVFVHGALCVCYSGQCLMSSLIGGRSGNRGRCAQPCRLSYELVGNGSVLESGYLLSTRDLNLCRHLPALVEAGIDAFKIEGRLRRPEYVAVVVGIYRRVLDRALAGDFYVADEEQRDLAQIFNRRFSTGYFFGRPGRELMNFTQPNNRGLPAGRIQRYDARKGEAEIALDTELAVGDGIDFWVSVGGRVSTEVQRLRVAGREVERAPAGSVAAVPVEGRIKPGDRVFKTWDASLLRRARETYASPREIRKISIRASLRGGVGQPLRLLLDDGEGHTVTETGSFVGETAQKRPLTRETAAEHLGRLGNTPFEIAVLEYLVESPVMYPLSEVNELRRRAVESLAQKRAADYRRSRISQDKFAHDLKVYLNVSCRKQGGRKDKPLLTVAVSDLDCVYAAVDGGADVVFYPGEGLGTGKRRRADAGNISEALGICRRGGARFYLWVPRIVRDGEFTKWKGLINTAGSDAAGILAGNLGVAREYVGGGLPIWGDYHLNVFNTQTICFLAEMGLSCVTLSPELTLNQVRGIAACSPLPVEALVQGSVPLMVSDYCVVGAVTGEGKTGVQCKAACKTNTFMLKDRLGVLFPVAVDPACRMHIFNSRDLSAVDAVPELVQAGVAAVRIDGRLKSAAYVLKATGIYRKVIDACVRNPDRYQVPDKVRADLEALSPQGFTKGHYYRGVL